jgi:hypothetical protein
MKKPASVGRRRAFDFPISLAFLSQAMQVRRHGSSMMVMAVMAVALHLFQTLRANPGWCQMFLLQPRGAKPRMERC